MGSDEHDGDPVRHALARSRARANLLFVLHTQATDDLARARAALQRKEREFAEGEEMRRHLATIVNSRSWRLTAPLRAVIGWAKRRS
jgi:hypothetical protein